MIKGSVVDSEGNIYVVGEYFPGTKVFGVDPVPLDIATATTNRSIVIAKLNKEGDLVWYKGIYNGYTNGGMGNQCVRDIRLVGDTAIMVMASPILLPPPSYSIQDFQTMKLYYLDTMLDYTQLPWHDSIPSMTATAFITFGLDGSLMENHFLLLGAIDTAGIPFPSTGGHLSARALCQQFFDIDSEGNIYVIHQPNGHSFGNPNLYTDSTGYPLSLTVANGGVGALRVFADGRGDMYITPPHKAAGWNWNITKFSPHFERLLNSICVYDSTDVYSKSDIFLHPSTGAAYTPHIVPTSFRIDEHNNVYMLLELNNFSSRMPLSNSDTLAFTGHNHDYYADLLIKYDSSLTPQYAKQLRSTYGTDDPNQCQRWFLTGSVGFNVETNTVYVSGKLQKNFMGATDNEAVQIYYDSDTLDLKNNFFWLRLDRDNGSLVSYGKVQSGFQSEILTSNSAEPNLGISNGKVAAIFNYRNDFTFADTTIYSGNSYNFAQAMAIWDEDGNELACYDFNAIHDYNRTGGVYVHDSTLYVTGVVYSGATFGDTVLASTGGRSQAFIAKYVNPIFMQQTGTREQQHIVWNQTLDFSAQPSPIALNATATSGLPVHYASSNPGVAYIDGENLFFAGEGDATVTATQPGNYLFFAAQPVTKPVITPSGHNPGSEGIQQASDGSQQAVVSVYPNPTGSSTVVTCELPIKELSLCDLMGRQLAVLHNCGTSATLDLSAFARGLCLIKVKTSAGMTVRKVSVR